MSNMKLKLLYLADILRSETDEDNPLSGSELIKRLALKTKRICMEWLARRRCGEMLNFSCILGLFVVQ